MLIILLLVVFLSCVFGLQSMSAKYLLRIKVSVRNEASYSNRLLEQFTNQYKALYPDHKVIDCEPSNIPHLNLDELDAGRTDVSKHSPALAESFKLANQLTEDLIGASHVVIATPMHNWGMPSSLKAWFDRVINVKTFYSTKPLGGIPFSIIISSGGAYTAESNGRVHMDHLRGHLKTCITAMGAIEDDIKFIDCEPAGMMDYGKIEWTDPNSPYSKALSKIPSIVNRVKVDAIKEL